MHTHSGPVITAPYSPHTLSLSLSLLRFNTYVRVCVRVLYIVYARPAAGRSPRRLCTYLFTLSPLLSSPLLSSPPLPLPACGWASLQLYKHGRPSQPLEPFGLRRHTKPLSLSLSSRALTPLGGDDSDVRTNAASKGSAAALLVAELAGLLEAFGCEFLLRRQRQARQAKPSQKKKPKQACLPACLPACLL